MKKIKDLADEIGVSKQAVFKRIWREPLASALEGLVLTQGNTLLVLPEGESVIKGAFGEREKPIENYVAAPKEEWQLSALLEMKDRQIESLVEQLRVKDDQLNNLQVQLKDTTVALMFAQQTAATAQKMFSSMAEPRAIQAYEPEGRGRRKQYKS